MIFIVIALFLVTLVVLRPRKKLNRKEIAVLFVIYLSVGITVRAILFIFGM